MRICPYCGEEVRDLNFKFHKCGQRPEDGKSNKEQRFGFVDFLSEWWVYCIFTPSFSGTKLSKFDDQNKFDILKGFLYNTTTIIITVWLLSLLVSDFLLGEFGIVTGLIVLISPPYLMYLTKKTLLYS